LATRSLFIVVSLLGSLTAQRQFAESAKTYVPLVRDASRAVCAADFDRDFKKHEKFPSF
jgi:hypothetical protein